MKFLLIAAVTFSAPIYNALAQSSLLNPVDLVSPIQVIHNAEMSKQVLSVINNRDARFRIDRSQGERYAILKSKTCEIVLENWQSVEKYTYSVHQNVDEAVVLPKSWTG